jgi:hypothetical protein
MLRLVVAILAALVVGFVVITAVQILGTVVFPLPDGVDPMSTSDMAELGEAGGIPIGAMIFVLVAYVVGSVTGAVIAGLITREKAVLGALIFGGILTVLGVINFVNVPSPVWFSVITFVCFVPPAYLVGRLMQRKTPTVGD